MARIFLACLNVRKLRDPVCHRNYGDQFLNMPIRALKITSGCMLGALFQADRSRPRRANRRANAAYGRMMDDKSYSVLNKFAFFRCSIQGVLALSRHEIIEIDRA